MNTSALPFRHIKIAPNQRKWEGLLFWFSFLMAFPSVLLFGQNLSIFIFLGMFILIANNGRQAILSLSKPIQWFAVYFAIGAILSVVNIPDDAPYNSLERSLAVLPNYIYWCLLVIFMVSHRRLIDIQIVYKGIFWGVLATLIYYLFLEGSLKVLPFFNRQTPNNFAFILICYTPIAVYYLMNKKGKIWAISLLLILTLILLLDGRRAGTVLVFLGGLATIFASSLNIKNILMLAVSGVFVLALIQTKVVENFILNSSERIHTLIYQTEEIRKNDTSLLTRIAMINKGVAIYEKHPYTGIGLNNFMNYSIQFDKSFEGAKHVIYKENLQRKSAHNSYIALLAEGGIILLSGFLLIVGTCLLYLLFNYFSMPPDYRPVYIGFSAMLVHLYFISAIVNVYAWFLIGLACSLMYRKR